jgi:hypothetical protein
VSGESELHRLEAHEPGTVAAALQAATQDYARAVLWIESVRLDLRSPLDRAALRQREDATGEVLRLVDELRADGPGLRDWVLQNLDKLPPLPADLADLDFSRLDAAQLEALLADAEATVLSQLTGGAG